jgi:ribosomal protein S5
MASVTPTSMAFDVMGTKNVVTAVFGTIATTNTWASPLNTITGYSVMIEEAAAAADALTITGISGGTVTFGVDGTIGAARVTLWGT